MAALDARQQAAATRIQSLIRGREGRKKAVVKRKALVQQRFTLRKGLRDKPKPAALKPAAARPEWTKVAEGAKGPRRHGEPTQC